MTAVPLVALAHLAAHLFSLLGEAMEKRAIDDVVDETAEAAMFEPRTEDQEDESAMVSELPAA